MKSRRIKCDICKKGFIKTAPAQKYHPECAEKTKRDRSQECARRFSKKRRDCRHSVNIDCDVCRNPFTPKKPGVTVCPICVVRRGKAAAEQAEAEDRPITEPGPCHSCREVDEDRRGIAICPLLGDRPCTKVNPFQNCGLRIPDWSARDRVEQITDTLVRRNGKLEEVRKNGVR